MKKFLTILTIIIVTVICTLLIKNIYLKKNYYAPTFYQATVNQSEISDKTAIQLDNLKITLKGLFTDGINNEKISNLNIDEETINTILKSAENRKLNLLVDFSTTNETSIHEPMFDYFIYDNSGNVIMTSIIFNLEKPDTNKFLKYFAKNKYNSNDVHEIENHTQFFGYNQKIVNHDVNSYLMLISSLSEENAQKELDLSKVHILIVNPSYKTSDSNDRIYLDDTIFEFILEQ